jgi:hypothetical protein
MSAGQTLQPTAPSTRRQHRIPVVHVVEYSRFPRRDPGEHRRVAYTQDRSKAGLGLDLPEPVHPGELLHVTLRDIDGDVAVEGLARVVWCKPGDDGRARAGLAMLRERGEAPILRVRKRDRGQGRSRRSLVLN